MQCIKEINYKILKGEIIWQKMSQSKQREQSHQPSLSCSKIIQVEATKGKDKILVISGNTEHSVG